MSGIRDKKAKRNTTESRALGLIGNGLIKAKEKVEDVIGPKNTEILSNAVTDVASGKHPVAIVKNVAVGVIKAYGPTIAKQLGFPQAAIDFAGDLISGRNLIEAGKAALSLFGINFDDNTVQEVTRLMKDFKPEKLITFGLKQIQGNTELESVLKDIATPFLGAHGTLDPGKFVNLGTNLAQVLNLTMKDTVMASLTESGLAPEELEKIQNSGKSLVNCIKGSSPDTLGLEVLGVMKTAIKTSANGTEFMPIVNAGDGLDALESAMRFTAQSTASYLTALGTNSVTVELPPGCDIAALKQDKQALDSMMQKFEVLVKEAKAAGLNPAFRPEVAKELGLDISADANKGIEVKADLNPALSVKAKS